MSLLVRVLLSFLHLSVNRFKFGKSIRQLTLFFAERLLVLIDKMIHVVAPLLHCFVWLGGNLVGRDLNIPHHVSQNLLTTEIQQEVLIFARIILKKTRIRQKVVFDPSLLLLHGQRIIRKHFLNVVDV